MRLNRSSLGVAALLLLSHFVPASVQAKDGSCKGHTFPVQRDGKSINTSWPLRVLRQNTPVYYDAGGSRSKTTLKFGTVLDALRISDSQTQGRVEVCESGCLPGESLGWMDREDLLCDIYPLKNDKGLERKAFIKTPPQPEIVEEGKHRVKKTTVTAYSCYDSTCKTSYNSLSRFEMYFIVAEKPQRYLLADKYNLLMAPPLVGWVDKKRIVPWNTTLQLRPKENVNYIRAFPNLNPSARGVKIDPTAAVDLAGGNTWYKFPLHVPLLDIKNYGKYYHVSAPGIGMKGFDVEEMNQQTAVVEKLKHVDVFFLLDGTHSMQASLDAAKKFARQIVNELSNQHDYRETHFRFGFRVYRDDFQGARWPGDESIGEGLPLSGICQPKANITQDNQATFNRKIFPVKESDERGDEDPSYEENLFRGIRQAIQDMGNCPNRLKLLFVIGDHGDNQGQSHKLIQRLTQTFTHSVRLFFIQAPNDKPYNAEYQTAYNLFQTQANSILAQVYPGMDYRGNLKKLNPGTVNQIMAQLATEVVQQVSNHSTSSTINEVIQKLRAGQSVKEIIEQGMREGDLPVLYWQLLKKDLCQTVDEQCEHPVDHRVIDAYIPVSDDLVEEIWIISRDLDNWKSLLRPLFKNIQGKPFDAQKREFVRVLKEELMRILGEPLLAQAGETLADVLKRKSGLPVREHSPLMQYTVKEIRNMQRCEFQRLTKWVESIYTLLNRLTASPTFKVAYSLANFPDSQCPRVSAKGRNIKRLTLAPPKALGPNDEYRYDHSFRKDTIFSIPKDFLP
ncbi:MAG: hypothetical protein DRR19_07710 [Candidatus Parabeggiatoa sp. nov. 1]|nr:MAG: hypothetical protein DRR19_07710 [Gammaproteobacteria bacterium]